MFKHSTLRFILPALAGLALLSSCEKDEGNLPHISFKTGGNYVSGDATRSAGDTVLIGITASKAEKKDPLKKFSISRSVNGGASATIFSKDLSGDEGNNFAYDYTAILDTAANHTESYTFVVTNRDGLVNQVSLKVTAQ